MKQRLVPFIDDKGTRRDHFFVDPKTDILYFKKGHAGRKIKFSTKIKKSEFVKAQRFANQEFDKRTGKKMKPKIQSLVKDELELWFKVKEAEGWAYDTMNNIRRAKTQIEEFWGDKFPREITADNLTEWYSFWREKHPDIEMENAVKYMRNFCKYLARKIVNDRPLIPIVPVIADPNYRNIRRARKKKKERIFTANEFKTIVNTAENEEHALLVLIMYTMATRITETLEMRFGEEILMNQLVPTYHWRDGQNKADHDGRHALHSALLKRLERLETKRIQEGTSRLFPQKQDNQKALREQMIDWDGWRERANLGWHWTPHTFRHTCLSNLFNDEKNPQALICKLYRVSLAVAMETYIKPTESGIEKMKNAIEVNL